MKLTGGLLGMEKYEVVQGGKIGFSLVCLMDLSLGCGQQLSKRLDLKLFGMTPKTPPQFHISFSFFLSLLNVVEKTKIHRH